MKIDTLGPCFAHIEALFLFMKVSFLQSWWWTIGLHPEQKAERNPSRTVSMQTRRACAHTFLVGLSHEATKYLEN